MHVSLPVTVLLRRAYAAELIWAALVPAPACSSIDGSVLESGCRRRRCAAGSVLLHELVTVSVTRPEWPVIMMVSYSRRLLRDKN
jgi:hypothetical protein